MTHNYKKKNTPENVMLRDLRMLQKSFPGVFNRDEPKPLKVGIHKDVREKLKWSLNRTARFFNWYCETEAYRFAVAEQGNKRVDLDGLSVQEVMEKHHAHAIEWLKEA